MATVAPLAGETQTENEARADDPAGKVVTTMSLVLAFAVLIPSLDLADGIINSNSRMSIDVASPVFAIIWGHIFSEEKIDKNTPAFTITTSFKACFIGSEITYLL